MIPKGIHRIKKIKRQKATFHALGPQIQAEICILISDVLNFKLELIERDKEGHYKLVKETVQQESIVIIITYTKNWSIYLYETNTAEHERPNNTDTAIMGDHNTPLSQRHRSSKRKKNQ